MRLSGASIYFKRFKINNILKIKSCESLFNINNKYLHSTSLVKYPVFDKGKNYSGVNILKKKILLDFIEDNFLKELEVFQGSIIVPLGNSVSSTIDYLNTKHQLKLKCFLKGFPHPSGLNARKNILLGENLFSKNQIENIILDFKKPSKESYSSSLSDFKIRTIELSNWLKHLKN